MQQEEFDILDIVHNPHFQAIASVIRIPHSSYLWRKKHSSVPFWSLLKAITSVKFPAYLKDAGNRQEFINRWLALLSAIVKADHNLFYKAEDLNWLVQILAGPHASVVASMLLAYASAPDQTITPQDLARLTGTSESQWRKKCEAQEIPGALKRGRTWFMPVGVLKSMGVAIDYPRRPSQEDETAEEFAARVDIEIENGSSYEYEDPYEGVETEDEAEFARNADE